MPPEISSTTLFAQWLLTLGVGGALAAMMFFYYRRDSQLHEKTVIEYAELWKSQNQMWMTLVKENTAATAVNTKTMEALHKRLDEDREIQKLQSDVASIMSKLSVSVEKTAAKVEKLENK